MPLILGTNSIKDTGFDVANSCRFNDGSSGHLTRTQTAGNRRTWTWSAWVKFSNIATGEHDQKLFLAHSNTHPSTQIITNSMRLGIYTYDGSSTNFNVTCNRFLRDSSAWFHLVIAVDTTQSTDSNRVKIYINGVQETSFLTSSSYPSQNFETEVNDNTEIAQISGGGTPSNPFDGYMAEVCLIDGTALDPTSFGEFDEDTGIWKPIDVSGLTFGTNGFYLDFENSGSLGNDKSGNGNNFTVNNLTSIDQSTDTCTNNFATMNSLLLSVASLNFTQGNLTNNGNSSNTWRTMYSTIGASAGKWYFEVRINKTQTSDPNNFIIGIQDAEQMFQASNTAEIQSTSRGYGYRGNGGNKANNTTGQGSSYGDSYGSIGDIIGCAVDLDNHKIYFRKNGTYQNSGDPTSGATGTGSAFDLTTGITYMFGISSYYDDDRHSFNFGSPPYSESGGNSDGNGYGNFAGSVPSGYYALNTKNLAEYG